MNLDKKFKDFFSLETFNDILKEISKKLNNKEEIKKILLEKSIYNENTEQGTFIFSDGSIINSLVGKDKYSTITKNISKEEILNLISNKRTEDNNEKIKLKDIDLIINFLKEDDNFNIRCNEVYLKGINNLALPKDIVAEFIRIKKENPNNKEYYNSLINFSYKLLLNPLEESRKNALDYVKRYNVLLTNSGNLILFRRILSKNKNLDKTILKSISSNFLKIKSQKRSPKHYFIHSKGDEIVCNRLNKYKDFNCVGNLKDLYNDLKNLKENTYTDNHTRTYDIKIGSIYKIRDEEIDLNSNKSCGGALHVTASHEAYDYSSFGDTPVSVLVSPTHIFKTDTGCPGKIGVREMFIMGIASQDKEGNYKYVSSDSFLKNCDFGYHNQSFKDIRNNLNQNSIEDLNTLNNLSIKEIETVKNILDRRVIKF